MELTGELCTIKADTSTRKMIKYMAKEDGRFSYYWLHEVVKQAYDNRSTRVQATNRVLANIREANQTPTEVSEEMRLLREKLDDDEAWGDQA